MTALPNALPFRARGPLSGRIIEALTGGETTDGVAELAGATAADTDDSVLDDDLQLSLFVLYANVYGSLPQLRADLEWDIELVRARQLLEQRFEQDLRAQVPMPEQPPATSDAVARTLFAMAAADSGPSLSRYVARRASREQVLESLMQRSVYTLREADPHTWAIPRLTGKAKAALVEVQTDEYGGGRADRMHAAIFAKCLRGAGLDDTYGAYVDRVPAITLASHNMMSLFCLNRRLVGAIVGHLAAYEMTSSIPCRMYADGLRRLGFDDDVADYFDEHVEADAVHEQIAGRDLAGGLAEQQPDALPDILFGAAACLHIDGQMGAHIMDAWADDRSSLREDALV